MKIHVDKTMKKKENYNLCPEIQVYKQVVVQQNVLS